MSKQGRLIRGTLAQNNRAHATWLARNPTSDLQDLVAQIKASA